MTKGEQGVDEASTEASKLGETDETGDEGTENEPETDESEEKPEAEPETDYKALYEREKKFARKWEAKAKARREDSTVEERLAAIEHERDELLRDKKRSEAVSQVATETGVPAAIVEMLSASEAVDLRAQAQELAKMVRTPTSAVVRTDGAQPEGASRKPASKEDALFDYINSL